jgi:hypothetical protein
VRSIKRRRSFFLAAGIALFFSLPNLSAQQPHGQARLSPGQHFAALEGIRLAYRVSGHGPILVEQSVGWGAGSGYLQLGLKPLEQHFTVSRRAWQRPVGPADGYGADDRQRYGG